MRYRKLDDNGDHSFGSSENNFYINSPEAIRQSILTRLRLWLGEWFADKSDGTGWNQTILGKQSQGIYELTLRQRVLETFGVVTIDTFESSLNVSTRKLTVSMSVSTIYGTVDVTGDL